MFRLSSSMRTAVSGAALTILAGLPFAASAADQVFLNLDGIQGSSPQANHLHWMDILSFSFGVSEPSIAGAGTGGTVARPDFSTINVMKLADRADVPMLRDLLMGTAIKSGTLDIVGQAGATAQSVARVRLTNAKIVSVQTSGSSETPAVSVSIAFEKIQFITFLYGPDGSLNGQESVSYDVLTNTISQP
jgi:type VI secretion system secreted protein Hcp